ncbi:MAG: helix-turn-helix transcriptional regulator [Planctomycetes bacterium]|nr:helix-turn-helix transcriptional regulator [Planctomycetota bacterium]MBL7038697.1 helix-turn-helix transcriptional regulator [Pirellulaceae bacterium]
MIRSEVEYRESVRRLKEQNQLLGEQKKKLEGMGLGPGEVKRAMDPLESFREQLAEEIDSYDRLKRGEFGEVRNLRGIGQLLIAARIFRGLSQRDLAERLGVHESQVSRDERNEYHNITLERAARILDVLDVDVSSHVEAVPAGVSM